MSAQYPHRNFFTKRYSSARAKRRPEDFSGLTVRQIVSHAWVALTAKVYKRCWRIEE